MMSYSLESDFLRSPVNLISGKHYFFGTSDKVPGLVDLFKERWGDNFVQVPLPKYSQGISRLHAILSWNGDSKLGPLVSFSPERTFLSHLSRGEEERVYQSMHRFSDLPGIAESEKGFYDFCLNEVYGSELSTRLDLARVARVQNESAFRLGPIAEYEIVGQDS